MSTYKHKTIKRYALTGKDSTGEIHRIESSEGLFGFSNTELDKRREEAFLNAVEQLPRRDSIQIVKINEEALRQLESPMTVRGAFQSVDSKAPGAESPIGGRPVGEDVDTDVDVDVDTPIVDESAGEKTEITLAKNSLFGALQANNS